MGTTLTYSPLDSKGLHIQSDQLGETRFFIGDEIDKTHWARYAQAALSPDFIDRTLPAGRPQGPTGPLAASQAFRKAVPDLRAEIDEMMVAGDRVSVHLHFHGHFSGQFGTVQGQGQPIDFQAFDLYRVAGGRIAENWHLEDNLSLMQQLGVIAR